MNNPVPGLNNKPKNASKGVYTLTGAVTPISSITVDSTFTTKNWNCTKAFSNDLIIKNEPLR